MTTIEDHYTRFWLERLGVHLYPTEFLVRTLLSRNCPDLAIDRDYAGKEVLDLGCGDGRNMGLLSNLGLKVSGTEITKDICDGVSTRLRALGIEPDIREGRNRSIPFPGSAFDYVVASSSLYYVDPGTTFQDNLDDVVRVLRPGGYLIASLVHPKSFILHGAAAGADGHYTITHDPLGLRDGCTFRVLGSRSEIRRVFSGAFADICIGRTSDDYYGLKQDLWLLVARKRRVEHEVAKTR